MNRIPNECRTKSRGNDLFRCCVWFPGKNGKEAANSNCDVWGGWVFESESEPGYVAWFDYTFTPSEIMLHEFTHGHNGKIY